MHDAFTMSIKLHRMAPMSAMGHELPCRLVAGRRPLCVPERPDPSDECLPTGKNGFTNKSNVTLQHDSNDAVEGSATGAHAEA